MNSWSVLGSIAISPAPNRSCYEAGILYLLEPKRWVVGGLFKCPPASDGWLTERSRSAIELIDAL